MARLVIVRRLQHNDEDAFRILLREVLYGLHERITHAVLSVEIIIKITAHHFAPYFQSPEAKDQFQDKLTFLHDNIKAVFEFVRSFYWFEEIYAPYGVQQWDELFVNMAQGVKRYMLVISHMVDSYMIPEFTIPTAVTNMRLERMYQEYVQFPKRMSEQLAKILEFIDEDYLETVLSAE